MYDGQREMVEKSSRELTGVVQKMLTPSSGSHAPGGEALARAAAYFKQRFDPVHGGAAGAPKFPATFPIRLFLRYFKRSGDAEALRMAAFTLEKMAAGGMYDHVGGGFHRYSVDERWHVPHFEKMLYDNALLASAYLEGWQATGEEKLRRIVVEIFDYVEREMTAPSGAFFSAADADSLTPDGRLEEGWFFTWTPDEVVEVVGRERARIVNRYYAIGVGPDFEGRYIPRAPETADAVARSLHMAEEELVAVVEECRELLRQARARRKAPLLDDKIITSWNGLMISALARAGLLLGDSRYTRRAEKAAGFILDRMYKDNRLFRTCRDGAPRHMGCLEDHAFFIAALLDLYEASHDPAWFEKSLELDQVLEARFEDKKEGGFFMTADDHENLIAREKPAFDGALPSGNAVAVHNLLRMALFTSRDAYRKRANKALACFSTMLEENPAALSEMLPALDFSLDSPKQIVIVTPEGKKEAAEPFLAEFRKQFLPNRVLAAAAEGEDLAAHGRL
ncbi:MAG: thioredoxin domain-containing protein, partial [Desulfobacterales bacterium]|nr:thioredoxin domain-containing protein [Desulfobacterales bacterium]